MTHLSDNPRVNWYYRTYPEGHRHDPRCLAVLTAWEALYNIPRTGRHRPDGGFRKCGDGVEVHLIPGFELATFDDDALTRLVLAAHQHHCRVAIHARQVTMVLTVHPREEIGRLYGTHPGLDQLARQAACLSGLETAA